MAKLWANQISNRNFLSPVGFKFSIAKIPKADFFANQANIPGIDLGFAVQPTYLKDLPVPGDKLTYGDFNLRFIIDENMENGWTLSIDQFVENWNDGAIHGFRQD